MDLDHRDLATEQAALLAWSAPLAREIPWRLSRDPWQVLVSEVMSQQTQIDRVVPKWRAFVDRWADPEALAEASLAEVLEIWSGLGYPRRARWLRETAQQIVTHHGGQVPRTLSELMAFPGIGPYTARAVLTFAYEQDVGVVDTNTARVLARRVGRRLGPQEAQSLADDFVPAGRSWDHNAALIDLGAKLCRPLPACELCPLQPSCVYGVDAEMDDPAAKSFGVSVPQSRFEGSDRQARGQLLRALTTESVSTGDVARLIGRADDVAVTVVRSLINDGLVEQHGEALVLAP